MGLYKNNNGVLSPIAGRGKAEYGASTVRTGTVAVSVGASSNVGVNVTFDTPMPDNDYEVNFTFEQYFQGQTLSVYNKTVNGFGITVTNSRASASSYNITYTAFKLYTDNEYNGLLNNQRYSTDEIDTGKTWIDGKKIYRKVFTGGRTVANGNVYDCRDLNIQSMVNMTGSFNGVTNINAYVGNNYLYTAFTGGYIQTMASSTWVNIPITVILEYTKTTD